MDKRVYFYKITNTINNKLYIGQSVNPKKRWYNHRYRAYKIKMCQYLHHAMLKYGVENFTFEVIASSITFDKEEIDKEEENLIQQHNSRFFANGYNVRPGGSTRGNWKHSDETIKKLIENWAKNHPPESMAKTFAANRGRKMSESHRLKIIEVNKNNKYCLGYKQPKEIIQKRIKAIADSYGNKQCSISGCNRNDGHRLNGIRYCNLHLRRIKKYGTVELPPRVAHNKGSKMTEEAKKKLSSILKGRPARNKGIPMDPKHKEKLRQLSIGRIPHNKIKFTDEQIYQILTDRRGGKKIAKDFGVTYPVIKRIRLNYQIIFEENNDYKIINIKSTNHIL